MSITDELREWAEQHKGWHLFDMQLNNIADLIDNAALSERNAAYNKGYDEGFASADDWLAQHEDAMAEHGWVRLPKDANGEYVHVGDVMVYADGNTCPMKVVALVPPAVFLTEDGPRYVDMCRHKPPTVEDVLREFSCVLMGKREFDGDVTEAVAEYAKRLRLRED